MAGVEYAPTATIIRPRMLDICCGGGGISAGYAAAGFEVVGVDINPQRRYPFEFHQADAIDFIREHGHEFDAIHASFPCGSYTDGAKQARTQHLHPKLIAPGRAAILATGRPYIIENVPGARADLRDPFMLCGTSFGLGVFRHRLFEAPWLPSWHSPPLHHPHQGRIGDGRYFTVTGGCGGESKRRKLRNGSAGEWRTAMGIDWMTAKELSQAIPPPYSRYVGGLLMSHLSLAVADPNPA